MRDPSVCPSVSPSVDSAAPAVSCRCPAGCPGPAAADYRQPAGRHHGEASICMCSCLCWTLLPVLTHYLCVSQAQQMTMQAMAMVSSPVTSPPTSPITSPPMSPLLQHPSSPYAPPSPYAVIPPSPYANIPPSPYANFTPSPYAAAHIPPSPYPPGAQQGYTASQADGAAQYQHPRPDPNTQPSRPRAESDQPQASIAAQVSNSQTCEASYQSQTSLVMFEAES